MSESLLTSLSEALLQDRPIPPARLRIADALAAFLVGLNTDDGNALARLHGAHRDALADVPALCAITRLSECDDIELASCVTPGSVVIPVALAHGGNCTPHTIERAIAKGYESGLALGRAIGGARALPKTWPTLLAAPIMAAVTIAFLKEFEQERLLHAITIALAGWNGRAGRPVGSPSGRWIAFADAVHKGISAAHAAAGGFRGDPAIVDGDFGMRMEILTCTDETGYKPFPIARQAATAVEAFQRLLARGIDPATIESVTAVVPRMNVALLSRPVDLHDRSSLLCNLGFQLACAAFAPELLYDPERRRATPALVGFAKRVTLTPTDEFDDPRRWPARVHVQTSGEGYVETLDEIRLNSAPFDEDLLQQKWRRVLKPDDRREFFENVVPAGNGSHVMLWDWVRERLARAARSGAASHENH